jgi:hypothetical protein
MNFSIWFCQIVFMKVKVQDIDFSCKLSLPLHINASLLLYFATGSTDILYSLIKLCPQ